MSRNVLSILVLALVAPVAAGAGTVFDVVVEELPSGKTEASRLSLEGRDLRMDQIPDGSDPSTTMIFHGAAGEILAIDHGRRETTVIDRDTIDGLGDAMAGIKAQMEQAMAGMPTEKRQMMEQVMKQRMEGMEGMQGMGSPAVPIEIRKTGETGSTDRWDWTRYEAWRGDDKVAEFLVADWSELGVDESDFGAFEDMAAFFQEMVDSLGESTGIRLPVQNPFAELGKVGGFPVVTRRFEGGTVVQETTLRSVESRSLDSGLFADPGYPQKRLEMPGR